MGGKAHSLWPLLEKHMDYTARRKLHENLFYLSWNGSEGTISWHVGTQDTIGTIHWPDVVERTQHSMEQANVNFQLPVTTVKPSLVSMAMF